MRLDHEDHRAIAGAFLREIIEMVLEWSLILGAIWLLWTYGGFVFWGLVGLATPETWGFLVFLGWVLTVIVAGLRRVRP